MIYSTNLLIEKYKDFADPFGKIRRLVQKGELIKLSKGLYSDDGEISGLYIAGAIYGPSYISFNTALGYWGMIPEAVYSVTSATTKKNKKKHYTNKIAGFYYGDIPVKAYPYGIKIIEENGYSFMMGTKEKALCDKLYDLPGIKNLKELEKVLFEDMRINPALFLQLDRNDIYFIAEKYHSNNVGLLEKYLRRMNHE